MLADPSPSPLARQLFAQMRRQRQGDFYLNADRSREMTPCCADDPHLELLAETALATINEAIACA